MKFLETLKGLSRVKQVVLILAVIVVMGLTSVLVSQSTKPPFALLYAGLEANEAGEVIEALQQTGIPYQLQGEVILIPKNRIDEMRIRLAGDGLPRQSVQGYELLDNINGFSITSEMYKTSYWRAKEGELIRTILTIPGVAAAHVHIGAEMKSTYNRQQGSQTASVTVTTDYKLSQNQAEAIQYLVALAVAGLAPAEVAVIDTQYGILVGPGKSTNDLLPNDSNMENTLETKILALLEARLGAGNAKVSVSVDYTRELQRISSVTFDPESRVIRDRTTSEESTTSTGGSTAVTIASNLPDGQANTGTNSSSNKTNATESISYELSQTRTEVERLPGEVERISIAVLVNNQALLSLLEAGATDVPEQTVEALRQLVASAAGLDTARGDILTLEVMPFSPLPEVELTPAPSIWEDLLRQHMWTGIQALILAGVILVLVFVVIKPLLASPATSETSAILMSDIPDGGAFKGENDNKQEHDPVEYMREYMATRQEEAAELLKEWLAEDAKELKRGAA